LATKVERLERAVRKPPRADRIIHVQEILIETMEQAQQARAILESQETPKTPPGPVAGIEVENLTFEQWIAERAGVQ
jgi:hypothetical protein